MVVEVVVVASNGSNGCMYLSNSIQAFLNGVCVAVVDSAQEVSHPRD